MSALDWYHMQIHTADRFREALTLVLNKSVAEQLADT